jgi:hypothetical protein
MLAANATRKKGKAQHAADKPRQYLLPVEGEIQAVDATQTKNKTKPKAVKPKKVL